MLFDTIKMALVKELDLDPEVICEDTMIKKDLNLDSTETVVIALELKKKFGIDFIFPKDDVSLNEICKMAQTLLREKESV